MSECEGVTVPFDVWRDVRNFFLPIVAPCKDCLRGNPGSCWHGDCSAFRFRNIARRIEKVQFGGCAPAKPRFVLVEDEILSALAMYNRPVPSSYISLESTSSKANKYTAIKRLIRMGNVVETFTPGGARLISLPPREHQTKMKDKTEKQTTRKD